MFSSNQRLAKRTPAGGIGRKEYIEHLVEEFHTTTNIEAQEQVSANLANFAYDPINFPFLKESGALELFLQSLGSPNERLILHGIAGICNLCIDKQFKELIIQPDNIKLITALLAKENAEIVLNTITIFALLMDASVKTIICQPTTIQLISKYRESKNIRLRNLAAAFMKQFCTKTTLVDISLTTNTK